MKRTPLKSDPAKIKAWQQRSRKPLAVRVGLDWGKGSTLKTNKPMNRVGKVGRANIAANKKVKEHAEKHGLDHCEVCKLGLQEFADIECVGSFALTTAHKHKRAHYKGDSDRLSDPKEWVKACVTSHDRMEHDRELTDRVFGLLRP